MFRNVDSLWKDLERNVNYGNRYYQNNNFKISNRKTTRTEAINTFSFSYTDSASAKKVLVKHILKQGVLFELKTLIDSVSGPSKFVTEFYNSFTPIDTLLGKNILEDKTTLFFDALKTNDSIVLKPYSGIKFNQNHSKALVSVLNDFEFPKDRLDIKSHLTEALIKVDLKGNLEFIKQLYFDSYSDPKTQTAILKGLLNSNKKESYSLFLDLMESDLPLGVVGSMFYSYKTKDSLLLKASLFPKILQYSTIKEYKNPLYQLLSKVKDSGLIKVKSYSKYKNQIINDGKIDVKRNLSKSARRYTSYSKNLTAYVRLIFPYRNERSVGDFFSKLLNVNDNSALVNYYILLTKAKEAIPQVLKEKVHDNEENQYLLVQELHKSKLLGKIKSLNITQRQFAKSKLLATARFDKDKDSVLFLETRNFTTDKGGKAEIFFFKIDKEDSYGNSEVLHYISFLKSNKTNQLAVNYYYKSDASGITVDKTKDLEEQFNEIINLAIYKDRKRVSMNQSVNDYQF